MNPKNLGHKNVVKYLLKSGADVDHPDSILHTALHKAVSGSFIEIVEILIQNGADVNRKTAFGDSVFHFASNFMKYFPFF